jgi:RNA polymerase sigma factor (sigma-70 family)
MPSAPFSHVLRFLRHAAGPESDTDDALLARFLERGDEPAFEALVRRHGPMVLSVCQRVLRDPHLAEDCFQATFLVLARKAGTIADARCLASWLHGVAVRVARKARGQDARRRSKLMTLQSDVTSPAEPGAGLDDLKPLLDEEISRLPAKYRELVVLCYLQGKTNSEAARQLGCPEGTVFGRLARARSMLQARLVRRGVTLSMLALIELLTPEAPAACLSPALIAKATAIVTSTAGASPTAISLAHEVMRAMLWTKIMKITLVTVVLGVMATSLIVIGDGGPATARAVARATPLRPGEQSPPKPPEDPKVAVEAAVARGLKWLATQQEKDGSWPGEKSEKIENTSLALLALLASGSTHKTGIVEVQPAYSKNFERGLQFLLNQQRRNGAFDESDLVANAKATMVVCEAYVLTLDPAVKAPAQRGIDFIVKAQKKSGGWPAQAGKEETMTSTAWHVMAFKSADMGGLPVPMDNWKDTQMFLADCGDRKTGTTGGYALTPATARDDKFTPAATAMGLRCRQLQGWKPDHPVFANGIEWLLKQPSSKDLDAEAVFFTTQVFRDFGGDKASGWNKRMQTMLVEKQEKGDKDKGSWGPDKVRVRTTALSVLSLEVCSRKLPPFFRKD